MRLASAPRMADFAEWGEAVAEALGLKPDEFQAAYRANQREQHEEAIEQNVVAWALTAFMHDRERWEGTPADLLKCLSAFAERERVSTKSAGWPSLPNSLMRRLNEARGNLADVGIGFETRRISKGRRLVCVKRIGDPAEAVTAAPPAGPPACREGDDDRAKGGGTES